MRRLLPLLPLLLLAMQCAPTPEAPALEAGVSWAIAQDRAQRLDSVHYRLHFAVPADPKAPIEADMQVQFLLTDARTPVYLDFSQPTAHLHAWTINGDSAVIDHREGHLVIAPDLLQEGLNVVEITFTAGSESLNRQAEFMYSLLVPDRASTVFPSFDQPNIKATFDLALTLEAGWESLANGPRQATDTLQDGRVRHRFGTSDRIPTYLFTFVAGAFEVLEETRDGFTMQMLHRESDADKVARNAPEIFHEHFRALRWLEEYTGIPYPYQKFAFALLPNFQYGGMEHVGAIHYRATSLMLDESATLNNRLGRTRLIAHETAHMWFGNLVTMEWFNDVWMKEVFANFMADKVAREIYPEIDHDLNFLLAHYPAAYGVDRTQGANPIRQQLDNLKLAGTMYGNIIYHKAPIVVRQLEYQIGEAALQKALQDYLAQHAHANADWLDLLTNLAEHNAVFTEEEFRAWHEVWVADAGMPIFSMEANQTLSTQQGGEESRIWPQVFAVGYGDARTEVRWNEAQRAWDGPASGWNSTGLGYGVFPIDSATVEALPTLPTALERGSTLINAYENLVSGRNVRPAHFFRILLTVARTETDPQVLSRAMGYLQTTYWSLLSPDQRQAVLPTAEAALWSALESQTGQDRKKPVYAAYVSLAQSKAALQTLYSIWEGNKEVPGLTLSVPDKSDLALELALKWPERYETLIATQKARISNRDRQARFAYVAVAVHPDKQVRDSLFATYAEAENRALEPWVLSSLGWLHHPLRQSDSQHYLPQALDWLEDIQKTGDIFFPKRWLDTNFGPYQDPAVVSLVEGFLEAHHDYSPNLRAKILQAYDPARRAAMVMYGDE